jgi:hypothetical protein
MKNSRPREPCISRRKSRKNDIGVLTSVRALRGAYREDAANRCFDRRDAQLLGGGRCDSARSVGAVNSSTSSITTGVINRDIMNVPQKPRRRWIPHSAVRRQNTT